MEYPLIILQQLRTRRLPELEPTIWISNGALSRLQTGTKRSQCHERRQNAGAKTSHQMLQMPEARTHDERLSSPV